MKLSRRRYLSYLGATPAAARISLGDQMAPNKEPYPNSQQLGLLYDDALDAFISSFDKAYLFLDTMADTYAQGETIRLIQSYSDQQGLRSTAFTYDNALAIHAYLLRGKPDDLFRARVLGNALLCAQHSDNFKDGRLRQAYFVHARDAQGAYIQPSGAPFYFLGSSVGDLAWAGMALARLHRRTGESKFLKAAIDIGDWIYRNTFDTRGAGGYTAGVDANNNKLLYKATEHNIDVYAFFKMLNLLSGSSNWISRSQSALQLVIAMWNASGRFFWTGTGSDGVTINTSLIPEDVQTWSYLALLAGDYASSIDWVSTNLATVDTPQTINSKLVGNMSVHGVTFGSASLRALTPSASYDEPPDPNAAWLEGTAHTAAALFARKDPRNDDGTASSRHSAARILLDSVRYAQEQLGAGQTVNGRALPSGNGIVASSSVLNAGFGYSYYPNLHIGATSWYLIAGQLGNPFQL
jgi:hypothetical protein